MASGEHSVPAPDRSPSDDSPEAAASAVAQAEAAACAAEARAAAARARAMRLRAQLDGVLSDDDAGDEDDVSPRRRWWRRRPAGWKKVLSVGAATVVFCTALAASGYMIWCHREVQQERQRAAEFTEAAREIVTSLMSLDFNRTGEDIQHITDLSTGPFKDRFPLIAAELTKRVQESKVVMTATVNEIGIESMTDDSALVLVAASTTAQGSDGGAPQQPQSWHIALGLTKDGGRAKMSSVEFVQ